MRLYKYFEKAEYCDALIDGEVYFSEIKSLRTNKPESRLDGTEGLTSFIHNNIYEHKELGNLIYVYSTSTKNNEALKNKFGGFVVEIIDSLTFLEELNTSLQATKLKTFQKISSAPINYQKGLEVDEPLTCLQGLYLKPESYAEENEYRFTFITKDTFDNNDKIIYKKSISLLIDPDKSRKIFRKLS